MRHPPSAPVPARQAVKKRLRHFLSYGCCLRLCRKFTARPTKPVDTNSIGGFRPSDTAQWVGFSTGCRAGSGAPNARAPPGEDALESLRYAAAGPNRHHAHSGRPPPSRRRAAQRIYAEASVSEKNFRRRTTSGMVRVGSGGRVISWPPEPPRDRRRTRSPTGRGT